MNPLTIAQISAAVDAAFASALEIFTAHAADPIKPALTKSAPTAIGSNVTLRTDLYIGRQGAGFIVEATVDLKFRTLAITRQHGPEAFRGQPAPALSVLENECLAARAKRYGAECSVYDLADAEAKMSSTDPNVEAAGAVQKSANLAKRLQIKAELPKPQ